MNGERRPDRGRTDAAPGARPADQRRRAEVRRAAIQRRTEARRARWAARRAARPPEPVDVGLQHERTMLAWERSGISVMVAATLLGRYALEDGVGVVAALAVLGLLVGVGLLVWSGLRYDDLHEPLRTGGEVAHPRPVALVAAGTAGIAATGLVLTTWVALGG